MSLPKPVPFRSSTPLALSISLSALGTGVDAQTAYPVAGAVYSAGLESPAGATLGRMKERMAEMGTSMSDVAELRVYRVAGAEGGDLSGAWNEAYGANFNTEANPHKPVRTNHLVESLPGGCRVEVEAIVVRPAAGF